MAAEPFSCAYRVYYEDTDAGGVMYHARHLGFFDRARTDWLRHLGLDQSVLAKEQGLVFIVRSVNIRYRSPARLDDLLQVTASTEFSGRARFQFKQSMRVNDRLIAEADVEIVTVDAEHLRPIPVPEDIVLKLTKL